MRWNFKLEIQSILYFCLLIGLLGALAFFYFYTFPPLSNSRRGDQIEKPVMTPSVKRHSKDLKVLVLPPTTGLIVKPSPTISPSPKPVSTPKTEDVRTFNYFGKSIK